jgi:hypothetical protein
MRVTGDDVVAAFACRHLVLGTEGMSESVIWCIERGSFCHFVYVSAFVSKTSSCFSRIASPGTQQWKQ